MEDGSAHERSMSDTTEDPTDGQEGILLSSHCLGSGLHLADSSCLSFPHHSSSREGDPDSEATRSEPSGFTLSEGFPYSPAPGCHDDKGLLSFLSF